MSAGQIAELLAYHDRRYWELNAPEISDAEYDRITESINAAMVAQEAIYQEAKRRSEEMVGQTQEKISQLRKAGNEYMDDALRRTEEAIGQSLEEIRDTRMKFRAVTEAQEQRKNVNVDVEV